MALFVLACGGESASVRLDGDSLFFGARPANNDMCTADTRPTALSSVAYQRQ